MTDKLCGNCMCYSGFRFDAEIGRCRRFNITVQLRTRCVNRPLWKCKCMVEECMDRRG